MDDDSSDVKRGMLLRLASWLRSVTEERRADPPAAPTALGATVAPEPLWSSRAPESNEDEQDLDAPGPISAGRATPPGMSIEGHVDRQIEEARRRGLFQNLPGAGKPLAGIDDYEPDWWVRRKLAEEGADVPLPPSLELKRDVPRELARIAALADETRVRADLAALNARIGRVNAHHGVGPPTNLAPLDVETWVRNWRSARTR